MSTENPIQNTDAPQGAQEPLSTDATTGRTRGGDFDQNTLAHAQGRGANIEASSQSVGSPNGLADGFGVSGVAVSVKPTDRKTLEGSTPGDWRAKASDAQLPANPGPRQPVGQTKSGKNQ